MSDANAASAPIDLSVFQSEIEESISAARSLVHSWIPKDLDSSWDNEGGEQPSTSGGGSGNTSSRKIEELEKKGRPDRLGLGADPGIVHKRLAEERKLQQQLMGSLKKGKRRGDAQDLENPSIIGKKEMTAQVDEDSEEEESRAGAIKRKSTEPTGILQSVKKLRPTLAATTILSPPASPKKSAENGGPASPLSKNQRKKLRIKEAAAIKKRQHMLELQAEGLGLPARAVSLDDSNISHAKDLPDTPIQNGNPKPSTSSTPSPPPLKKVPRSQTRPPFAPLTSSSSDGGELSPFRSASRMANGAPAASEDGDSDEDEESAAAGSNSVSSIATPLMSPVTAHTNGIDGSTIGGKKKKRRQKKKKNSSSNNAAEQAKPILNLEPRLA